MDDQQLEYLGSRFTGRGIGKILRITFEHYLVAPSYYDNASEQLTSGKYGYNIVNGRQRLVATF